MRHNLYIGIVISPYRVDFCNWLYEHYDCEIYHLMERDDTQGYNLSAVESLCRFERHYLATGSIGGRMYPKGLRKLIEERNPDVVFVPEFSITTLEVLRIRKQTGGKFKVVSGCDDSLDMIQGNDFSRFHRLLRRIVPRYLDNIILVNDAVAQWYREHFGKGIVLPIVPDERRVRAQMEQALPLCADMVRSYALEGKKIVLFVGRLIALKNIGTLLEAARGLDARVVIVGDGEMRKEWEDYAGRLGVDALFTGRKSGDELLMWYHLADVFVLPSLQEAFGAVVVEALIAGCPAVVSRRAGASTLIDGINGATFDPSSPEELASSLRNLLAVTRARPANGLRDCLLSVSFEEAVSSAIEEI